MPEITVTVTAGLSGAAVGDKVFTSSLGFDHAALVTAKRSRADGYDLWLYHTVAGRVAAFELFSPNTTAAYLTFDVMSALAPSATDNRYRLVFGDLGWSRSRFTTPAGSSTAGAEYSVPAIALPNYGFEVTDASEYGVRESASLVRRAATLHEHQGQRLRLNYPGCDGATAYAVRAFIASLKGAASFSFIGFTYRYVPGSLEWEQTTAVNYRVSLEVELLQL